MRAFGAFVLAAFLWLPASAVAAGAPTPLTSLDNPPMLLRAKLVCGIFDGKFKCKRINKSKGNKVDPGAENGKKAPDHTDQSQQGGGGAGGGGAAGDAGADTKGGNTGDTANPGKRDCPPGYKVLDVPTKFGYCEPPEGLPNAAYTTCPAGATGVPPNCVCSGTQTDYMQGNKCVGWTGACGTDKPGWNTPQHFCVVFDKVDCQILPDGQEKCCCKSYNK
jgi:hypothetical protein